MTNLLHCSVLLNEAITSLNVKPEGNYIDATFGRGGYTQSILNQISTGHLISIDQDSEAIKYGEKKFKDAISAKRLFLIQNNYEHIDSIVNEVGLKTIDGIVFDLGVSSPQFDDPKRGFSYRFNGPLDMRMDQRQTLTAFKVINSYDAVHLKKIFKDYGNAPCSWQVAQAIVKERKKQPIKTTMQLVGIIFDYLPEAVKRKKGHPAKKFFQALRIEVNHELFSLKTALEKSLEKLKIGGIISVVTFQSLEDKIVSRLFRKLAKYQDYPKGIPIIPENVKPKLELTTRQAIKPSELELKHNWRAHSARLRSAKKIRNFSF